MIAVDATLRSGLRASKSLSLDTGASASAGKCPLGGKTFHECQQESRPLLEVAVGEYPSSRSTANQRATRRTARRSRAKNA